MDLAAIKGWFHEPTTIQGAMAVVGGALWGWFHGDWATGGSLIGLGAVGIMLRETPQQVIAQIHELVAQAQNVRVQADAVKAEATAIVTQEKSP